MTKTRIKLCGLTRACDISLANQLLPEYIGFVFAPNSRRYLPAEQAEILKKQLNRGIQAVGVFVNESPQVIADLLNRDIIDLAQLHGTESEDDIRQLKNLTDRPIVQAFRITGADDITAANASPADLVLLDSGGGTGKPFSWELLPAMNRPYFLAGGLTPHNVQEAVETFHPYAVDVSTGIETDGRKDPEKAQQFVRAVRNININRKEIIP